MTWPENPVALMADVLKGHRLSLISRRPECTCGVPVGNPDSLDEHRAEALAKALGM